LLGTFRASLLWPENRFTTALANINQLDLFIGRTLTPFYDNATSDYVAFVARSAMRNILTVPRNLDSSQIKSGPLKYARLQYIAHRHENPFDEGIRVVYVPQRLDDIPFDKIPADMIFIGGVQVPRQAVLRITVIRHYEGQVHSGMKNLYPVYEQPEDEEAIKILSLLIKKYPQILLIRPRDLEGIYKQVKDKFKWVDTALREDGTGFEVIRDYTRPMELILPQTE
jgi:hypothetical protein